MSGLQHILIVGSDSRLRDECQAALASAVDNSPVVHYSADRRQAVELARNWHPGLAVVQMDTDLNALRALVDDLTAVSPSTQIAGAFTMEALRQDISESALIIESLRAGCRDFLRRPVSAADLRNLVERLQRPASPTLNQQGRLTAFISNKGGVGKSTLSVNVAVGLALARPGKVLLVDASLQMGVCAAMLDLQPELGLADAAREHERLDERLLEQLATPHESGLHLLAAPANAVEGAQVSAEIVSRVLSLARRIYDHVIVDTFPLFDSIVMTTLDQADEAYIVIDNVVPTLLGIEKLLNLLASIGFPKERQHLVMNRYSTAGSSPRWTDAANRLDREIDLVIPLDRKLIAAANLGRPFLLRSHWLSPAYRRLRQLVKAIGDQRNKTTHRALADAMKNGNNDP